MGDAIENRGSLARDQLANERTFLAWVRTGLGFVGAGVIVAKLIDDRGPSALAMGIGFIVAGLALLLYGFVRYRKIAALLDEGRYRTARRGPLALVALCLLLGVAAAVYLVL